MLIRVSMQGNYPREFSLNRSKYNILVNKKMFVLSFFSSENQQRRRQESSGGILFISLNPSKYNILINKMFVSSFLSSENQQWRRQQRTECETQTHSLEQNQRFDFSDSYISKCFKNPETFSKDLHEKEFARNVCCTDEIKSKTFANEHSNNCVSFSNGRKISALDFCQVIHCIDKFEGSQRWSRKYI